MISIIIPVYNAEKYIEKCLDSILQSKYDNYEIIIVNDGSTDKTEEIIKNYQILYKNIKLITKNNGGSASARNVGLDNAQGEYIAFVDADDYIDMNYLNIMYEIMKKNDVDIVECDFNVVKNNNIIKGPSYNDLKNIDKNTKIITNIEKLEKFCSRKDYLKTAVLWNKLYKKDLFTDIRFVENKGIDDEFIIHKIIYKAKLIATTNMKLYYYYLSDNSQMRNKSSLKKIDNIEAIEDQMKFFEENGLSNLRKQLYYRYYRSIMYGYVYVKKYFPNEKEILLKLNNKRRKMYKLILSKYLSTKEKIYLICYRISPTIFNLICKVVDRSDKII